MRSLPVTHVQVIDGPHLRRCFRQKNVHRIPHTSLIFLTQRLASVAPESLLYMQ